MLHLENKVAVITGAAGGIGSAICSRFADEGAVTICVDADRSGIDALVGAITEARGTALPFVGDVAEEATARDSIAVATKRYGRLDILVCSAVSDLPIGPITDISHDDWRRSMAVNLDSCFLFAKHAIPAMAANGDGKIVLIASELARVAKQGRTWYCASKAALVGLARAIALDHAAQGIRANSLSPGPIETARYVRKFKSLEVARASAETLLDRLGTPEEIAAAALFLASDQSSFATGTDLLVDGGRTAV